MSISINQAEPLPHPRFDSAALPMVCRILRKSPPGRRLQKSYRVVLHGRLSRASLLEEQYGAWCIVEVERRNSGLSIMGSRVRGLGVAAVSVRIAVSNSGFYEYAVNPAVDQSLQTAGLSSFRVGLKDSDQADAERVMECL